ncbi:hypothetical protein ACLOJK_010076 [Asimina triloba]
MAFPVSSPSVCSVSGFSSRRCFAQTSGIVRCSVANVEKRVWNSEGSPTISPHLPLRPTSPSLLTHKEAGGGDGDKQQRYYVNLGYAIRTLREEFPQLFYRELSFDIYRDDIVFKDPLNTFAGISNYKHIFWALRFHGRILFKALWIDIISVWQPMENLIMIRWTVYGIPRVPWESVGRFDGTSEYKLDKDGKIYEHRVDNIALNSPPPKFRVLAVEDLIQSLGCPSTPKPTYFEMSSFQHLMLYVPFLVRFTWVRYYMAFYLTLTWRCAAAT